MMSASNNEGTDPNLTSEADDTVQEKTAYDCAKCDRPNHADHKMACCDICSRWYHYACVGVTDVDVENKHWPCPSCANDAINQGAAGGGSGDSSILEIVDLGLEDNLRWKENEEQQKAADEAHNRELLVLKEIQRRNFQRQLQREQQKRMAQLELEQEMLQMRRQAEEEFQQKRSQLWTDYRTQDRPTLQIPAESTVDQSAANEANKVPANPTASSTPLVPGGQSTPLRNPGVVPAKINPGPPPKPLPAPPLLLPLPQPGGPLNLPLPQPGDPLNLPLPQPGGPLNLPLPQPGVPLNLPPPPGIPGAPGNLDNRNPLPLPGGGNQQQPAVGELTKAQIAARKGPFQRLPVFTGKAEEWPMFFSSYCNGNLACNWSNLENLGRLQQAIQGPALERVRSQLLMPETVPAVIDTLKRFYGRPEQLLSALIKKAQEAKSPCRDTPETFSDFGIIVQQLADHLIASGLRDHLVNPHLIDILVAKLPGMTQIEWVRYRRQQGSATVKTLADFVSTIGADALEVEHLNRIHQPYKSQQKTDKKKFSEGFLHAHVGDPEQGGASREEQPATPKNAGPQEQNKIPCRVCNRTDHRTRYCDDFVRLSWYDRMKEVAKWKLCKLCLNEHGQSECRFKNKCNVGGCQDTHHPLLHPPANTVIADCNTHNIHPQQPVIFRVVPVRLSNGKHSVDVIAFLDEGASYSLVERELAEQIQLTGVPQPLVVKWTAGIERLERDSRRVHLTIAARESQQQFTLQDVHTVEQLKLPEQKLSYADVARKYPHLNDLPVSDYQNSAPRILIGLKHLHIYAPLESRIGASGEPIAVRTHLGWTIYGPQDNGGPITGFARHQDMTAAHRELYELPRNHHTLEESGVAVTILPESAASKIGEIRDTSGKDELPWVPTKMNIEDVLTKRVIGPSLAKSQQWVSGPEFIYLPEHGWPKRGNPPSDIKVELRACHHFHYLALLNALNDHTKLSLLLGMVRTLVCVPRVAPNCRHEKLGLPIEVIQIHGTSKILKLVKRPVANVVLRLTQEEHHRAECTLVLMRCLTTKAKGIEAVHELTSILAIGRFTHIRGTPLGFFSTLAGLTAPIIGGSWERSAKEALNALGDCRWLIDEVLLTALAKATEMISSRPLEHIPQDSSEVKALTPNLFLCNFPSDERQQADVAVDPADALRDQYKRSNQFIDILWQRCIKEYVPSINRPSKWLTDGQPIVEGDLVYVAGGTSGKIWVRGMAEWSIPGREMVIRRTVVRLADKRELRRPVNKLAVLGIGGKSSQRRSPGLELPAGALLAPLATMDFAATPLECDARLQLSGRRSSADVNPDL